MYLHCFNCSDRTGNALYLRELGMLNGTNKAHPAGVSPRVRFPERGGLHFGDVTALRDVAAIIFVFSLHDRNASGIERRVYY